MASKRKRIEESTAQTVGVATSTVCEIPTVSGASYHVVIDCVGRVAATGDSVSARRIAAVRNVAGVATLIGSVANLALAADAALAAALVTIDVDAGTNRIRVRSTGVLATTIDWWAEVAVLEWIP